MSSKLFWVTSNLEKVANLNATLELNGLPPLNHIDFDCREVLGSPLVVAGMKAMMAYKAVKDQLPEGAAIMIEDTTLDLPAVHDWNPTLIKYNIGRLPQHIGEEAIWTSHIMFCDGIKVMSAMASVKGTILEKVPGGFGFDPYFAPIGSDCTFGQNPAAQWNPRYLAMLQHFESKTTSFKDYDPDAEKHWTGSWQ